MQAMQTKVDCIELQYKTIPVHKKYPYINSDVHMGCSNSQDQTLHLQPF